MRGTRVCLLTNQARKGASKREKGKKKGPVSSAGFASSPFQLWMTGRLPSQAVGVMQDVRNVPGPGSWNLFDFLLSDRFCLFLPQAVGIHLSANLLLVSAPCKSQHTRQEGMPRDGVKYLFLWTGSLYKEHKISQHLFNDRESPFICDCICILPYFHYFSSGQFIIIIIVPSLCMAFYREHNIGQLSAPKRSKPTAVQ